MPQSGLAEANRPLKSSATAKPVLPAFSRHLYDMGRHGWYWGPLTRVQAEKHLSSAKNGTFLVRDSSDQRYLFSLSLRYHGGFKHVHIALYMGRYSFGPLLPGRQSTFEPSFPTVAELIEYYMDPPWKVIGSNSSLELNKPLSRFKHVETLQHYCRYIIRQSIRFDKIQYLPLPRHLLKFLEQSPF